ncbi:uncharacterized protein LOC112534793 [Ricinus communis]|uniref:uncharacterized protein LOC112534793 n=1 Tax=Ricinus communis TaxID=3988 RepID=UPI00201AA298|nr:uncharacterized protein LOC112534793 [Ricinus communis]
MVSENGKEDGLSYPLIIAMKGSSSTEKSELATKLASFLQYPLIDEGDIILALKSSIPSFSSTEDYEEELPLKIVSQICSTQISLKLHVIVNSELSQRAHFEHLVQLASSEGASLLIIDCEAQNGDALYDAGDVPKLNIDVLKPFVLEEFVHAILQDAEFPQEIYLAMSNGN